MTNTSRNGIALRDDYRDPQGNGSLTVEHNTVLTPTIGIPVPSPATPNGIVAGWFHNQAGSHDAAINSPTRLAHNFIEVRGSTSIGLVVLSDGAVISHNSVLMNGGTQTIGISVGASRCSLSHNEIAGSGLMGIRLSTPTATNPNSGNTLLKDDTSDLQAGQAGLVLLSDDNVVKNFEGSIDDQGTGNVIK